MTVAWRVRQHDPKTVSSLVESCNLDPLVAKCMLNRDLRDIAKIKLFLKPDRYTPPDPFLMPDMELAVARVELAIERGERICIYGDYDADGVTAIAILTQGLRELGVDAFYYIPDRFFEGVGLHKDCLRRLKVEERVGLVISVDTGIRAFEEVDFANEIGLDMVITDHHTPGESRPNALAVLNPKMKGSFYPFDGLCGAGVAFKLLQAIDARRPGKLNMNKYLQIAAIGTVADMVPLLEENRWIVSEGLRAMSREEHGPIRALLRRLGIRGEATALDISFKVAPRINAPGRLGDPDMSIAFFDCEDPKDIHRTIEIMDGMNLVRQMLEREHEEKLELQLRCALRNGAPPFIMIAGQHWHRGILGILACKTSRRFGRPACVLSFDSEKAHGSIRGVSGVNLIECLREIDSLLLSYGGHPEAAGVCLSVTNVPQFKNRMNELLAEKLDRTAKESRFAIDAEVRWRDLDDQVFQSLCKLAPFGIGNAVPVFLSPNLILESELLRRGPWFHFEVSDGSVSRKCSFYHPTDLSFSFERFDSVDLVYSLAPFRDDYQVQILEMRPSTSN